MAENNVEGWLFFRRGTVPPAWRDRAVAVEMIPLLPGEGAEVLGGRREAVDPHEERILRLVAVGRSLTDIARELGVTVRSVQRRVARIRKRMGVGSTGELVSLLARRGFS